MAICYGCVAIGMLGVIAEYGDDDGQNFKAVVSSMLPNIVSQETNKVYVHERYNFAVLPDNGFLYICTTTPDFPDKDSFFFLEELKQTFSTKNSNLRVLVGSDFDQEDGVYDSRMPNMTMCDGFSVKKIRNFSGVIKKKMKKFKNIKRATKPSRIHIPGFSKSKHTVDPSDKSAFVTPTAGESKDKYVPLGHLGEQDHQHARVWTERESPTVQLRIQDTSPSSLSSGQSDRTIASLQQEVEEVQGILRVAIEQVLSRGDKLEDLLARAYDLEDTANQFRKTTKRLKRKTLWRRRKITITVISFAGVVIIAVILVLVFTV